MSKTRLQQTISIGAIVLLLAFLFSRDVKGLVKPKEDANAASARTAIPEAAAINLNDISLISKNLISTPLSKEITSLENDFKVAKGEDKIKLANTLSKKWENSAQLIPSALYMEIVAKEEISLGNWVKAGNKLLAAFDSTNDTTMQPALLQKANSAFRSAMAIDSTNLDAKAGMGTTMVNGMGMPMDGIAMLLDVVNKDPRNANVLMQLGLFSIKSGQFDKAVSRFQQVIEIRQTSDAFFYLATAYESLGKKSEAVDAYTKSKRIAANPTFSKWIDNKVAELKK